MFSKKDMHIYLFQPLDGGHLGLLNFEDFLDMFELGIQ